MGPCQAIERKHSNQPKEMSTEHQRVNTQVNDDTLVRISSKNNETIKKSIKEMNGASLMIESNKNCVIMIMDYTSKVMITNCINCSIFIGPCSSDISIINSRNINVISASSNVSINNVFTGNFFLFTQNSPIIEQSENINLSIFCFQYSELPDMFRKANLCIWQNSWSQYVLINKPTKADGGNANGNTKEVSQVHFIEEANRNEILKAFGPGCKECIITFDQYQYHPFQYGKSINDKVLQGMNNLLMIFKEEFLNDNYADVLKYLAPDELKERKTLLIKTNIIKETKAEYVNLKDKIILTGNEYLIDYFNNVNLGSTFKANTDNSQFDFARTFEKANKTKQLDKGEVLLIWLVNEEDNFDSFGDYTEQTMDTNCLGWITQDSVQADEVNFQYMIKRLLH